MKLNAISIFIFAKNHLFTSILNLNQSMLDFKSVNLAKL